MQIPDKKIEELQQIYRQNYGIELSEDQARERGRNILRLVDMIYEPMTKQEKSDVAERRKETKKIIDNVYEQSSTKPWF
jgi:hypothetical protein